MDKIDNIKNLFKQIKDKKAFVIEVAKLTGLSPVTIRNTWLAQFWVVREEFQDQIIEMLQTAIKNQ